MKEYTNPIIPNSDKNNTSDPYVALDNGAYYHCYAGTDGLYISKAEKLWEIGNAIPVKIYDYTKEGALKDWYAPELHKIGEYWYIYAAPDTGNGNHVMAVLKSKSDNPLGEWENLGFIKGLEGEWSIDGTVFYAEDEWWFCWTSCLKIFLSKLSEPNALIGERSVLAEPILPFEINGCPIAEGPAVLQRNGSLHIVYSASDSKTDDYCLGVLSFNGEKGELLRAEKWTKHPEAVFSKTEDIFGPGHCSFTTVGERTFVVYHANEVAGTGWNGRSVWCQPIDFDEKDFPIFGKPQR